MVIQTVFTNGTIADADEVNANFALVPLKKASGTITIAADTTAHDINYADISFAAGDLTAADMVVIELQGSFNGGSSSKLEFGLRDTQTPTDSPTLLFTSELRTFRAVFAQDGGTNTLVQLGCNSTGAVGAGGGTFDYLNAGLGAGEANIFTTAFKIRINPFHTASGSISYIRYVCYVIKG